MLSATVTVVYPSRRFDWSWPLTAPAAHTALFLVLLA